MRILHVLSQVQLTGAEVHAQQLSEVQIKKGHQVEILSDQWHLDTSLKIHFRKIHQPHFLQKLSNILWLRKKIKIAKIDILHAHSRAAARLCYWAKLGLPVGSVSTVHGRQHYSLSKRIWNIYGEKIISICENVRKHLLLDFKLPEHLVHTVPNPISLDVPKKDWSAFHDTGPISIALVGRLTGPKGERASLFLESCLYRLMESHPRVVFTLIGDPFESLNEAAKKAYKECSEKFPHRVLHISKIKNLSAHLHHYHLILGGGRVAIEALASSVFVCAFGESNWHGLITPSNFSEALETNFGDIGFPNKEVPLNLEKCFLDLHDILLRLENPSELKFSQLLENQQTLSSNLNYFNILAVERRVHHLYRCAKLKSLSRKNIPILMYHKIVDDNYKSPHKTYISEKLFEKHLKWINSRGLTPLTFSDIESWITGQRDPKKFPKKPIILTFDDGYQNNLTKALPLLKKYNIKCVLYLLSDTSLKENTWDKNDQLHLDRLLNQYERKQMHDSGLVEIGSHGKSHLSMKNMSAKEIWSEFNESYHSLTEEFKSPIISFAYTFGDSTLQAQALAEHTPYQFVLNTDRGGLQFQENLYSLFRVNIFPHDGFFAFYKKTSSWYRTYFLIKKKR